MQLCSTAALRLVMPAFSLRLLVRCPCRRCNRRQRATAGPVAKPAGHGGVGTDQSPCPVSKKSSEWRSRLLHIEYCAPHSASRALSMATSDFELHDHIMHTWGDAGRHWVRAVAACTEPRRGMIVCASPPSALCRAHEYVVALHACVSGPIET